MRPRTRLFALPLALGLAFALVPMRGEAESPSGDPDSRSGDPDSPSGDPDSPSGDPDAGEVIEIEVAAKKGRGEWFPKLDNPRVQAYFRSSSMVGDSLFAGDRPPRYQPLVRAGLAITVRGASSAAERRQARSWARRMISERLSSLEACYADARQRNWIDASRIDLHITLDDQQRGAIAIVGGELGDLAGNECLSGVLAFAKRGAPSFASTIELEVPVWFWLQTERI